MRNPRRTNSDRIDRGTPSHRAPKTSEENQLVGYRPLLLAIQNHLIERNTIRYSGEGTKLWSSPARRALVSYRFAERFHNRRASVESNDTHGGAFANHVALRRHIQNLIAELGFATGAQC